LNVNNQFFRLAERNIEQCYPNQPDPTYGNWKKSQAELDAVNANGDKIITGKKKRQLAKHVGDNITQAQFEADLQVCLNALERCWELAF
jgi:putative ATP-dependent endonuclease of OLD family